MVILPLIQKHSITPMNGLAYYVKVGLIYAWKLCGSYLCFLSGSTSLSVLLLFLYQSPSSSLCIVFDSISSKKDKLCLTRLYHKDWLTYSGGTDNSAELFYNLSI